MASAIVLPLIAHAQEPKPLAPIVYEDENGVQQAPDYAPYEATILHFWATWCVPCVKELPEVDEAAATYAGKGVQFIAISMDSRDNLDKVKKFFKDKKIAHLPIYFDNNNAAFRAAKLRGLPATIFVNSKGEEIDRYDEPLDWKNDNRIVDSLGHFALEYGIRMRQSGQK